MISIRGEPNRFGVTAHQETADLYGAVGRNTGNLAFAYATALLLGFPRGVAHTSPIEASESISVFTLANHLGKHFDPTPLTIFLEGAPADWRALGVGLGSQGPLHRFDPDPSEVEIGPRHEQWMKAMISRAPGPAPSIAVRGAFTLSVLERMNLGGCAVVTGCPSQFISPLVDLGVKIAEKFSSCDSSPMIDGALGNPWDPQHKAFEQALIRLSHFSGGCTHAQMQLAHVRLGRGDDLTIDEIQALRSELAPYVPIDQFMAFSRRQFRVWWDVPGWLEALRRPNFVLGSRIHGIVLALQTGTPAMCVAWDSRTLELCRTMAIPHVSIYEEPWHSGDFAWDDIRRAFEIQFDPTAFDRRRRGLARTLYDFFSSNGIAPTEQLRLLCEQRT